MTDPTAYDDADTALNDAKRHHLAGRTDEAEALFRCVLELNPEHGEALQLLGAFRREAGDYSGAATYLNRAVRSMPESAAAWLELTRTQHDLAKWDDCAAAAERTLAIDAGCTEAELMRAVALFALQKHEDATASIEIVAAKLPEDSGVHLFHARSLMARELFAEALPPARRAAELQPESDDAQYLLGACLKRTGQNEAAEAALQRVLAKTPDRHEALNDLADIYIARGDTQAALSCLRRSHAATPYNLDAISGLRVRPETLCRITEFSEHESNGRELDEGERVAVEVLPVLGQSAAAVEPGDGAFDHPTPGLDDEALHPIGSLDDLGLEIGQDAGQGAVKDRALIGAVGEQFPEKGKQTEQGRQQRETAVAILNVGGGDDAVQQQALRIDQNMPLLALDQLAGIEAVAVDASPPFSALFTL